MNKVNTKPIVFGLKILSILAFSLLIIPVKASAVTYVYGGENGAGGYEFGRFVFNDNANSGNNPVPAINSIIPKSANIGSGAKTVTITGSNFIPSSIARVNGSNRNTTFIDYSHLLVQLTANDMYRTDPFFINVFNGEPGGGFSNSASFAINGAVSTNTNNNTYSNNNYSNTTSNNYTDTNYSNTQTTDKSYSNIASNAIWGSNSFLPSGLVQWVLFAIVILLIVILARKIFGAKESYNEAPMKHA